MEDSNFRTMMYDIKTLNIIIAKTETIDNKTNAIKIESSVVIQYNVFITISVY